MKTVSGVVESVGTKWNGSLKVNGAWHGLKKGVVNTAKEGDTVVLTLEGWDFKGKTGESVTKIEVKGSAPAAVAPKPAVKAAPSVSVGRDFDAENRGKTRCALLATLMSLVATETITLEQAKKIVNEGVEFVFTGK